MRMRTVLILLALGAAFFSPGCGGDEGESSTDASSPSEPKRPKINGALKPIAGLWGGTVQQRGGSPSRVAVVISPAQGVRVAYAGLECAGSWSLQGVLTSNPGQYYFTEQIDQGDGENCERGGGAVFNPYTARCSEHASSKRIECAEFSGNEGKATGLVLRISPAEMREVFGAARVDPPSRSSGFGPGA